MNTLSNLTLSKSINNNINASILPILLTKLKTQTLFNYVSTFIPITETYIELLKTIEENIKTNNLAMANLTIEYNNNNNNSIINDIKKTKSKKTKSKHTKSKKTKSKHTKQIKTI